MFSIRKICIPLLRLVRHTSSRSVPYVLSERVDSCIQVLTLNDEKKANCLSSALISELHNALRDIERDPDVRALIISGAGRFFSAGHDLNEIGEGATTESRSKLFNACSQVRKLCSERLTFHLSQKSLVVRTHRALFGGRMSERPRAYESKSILYDLLNSMV